MGLVRFGLFDTGVGCVCHRYARRTITAKDFLVHNSDTNVYVVSRDQDEIENETCLRTV